MKPLLFTTSLAVLCSALPAAETPSLQDVAGQLAPEASGTVIYTAREFLTIDPAKPKAAAVAVSNGKFAAVGSLEEVQAAVGKEVPVDRTFDGKVVTAGFVEQHVHPVLAALTMASKVISIEDWDAIDGFSPAVRDPEGYQKRLKEALDAHRKGPDKDKPFLTWGYHHYLHGDSMSRKLLNELAPDFPAVVWHRSCHEFFLNDLALKTSGIDQAFFDALPKAAKEQASWERGHFFEQGAMAILGKITSIVASKSQFIKGLEFTESYYLRNGITTACEPGGFFSKPI